MGELKIGAAQTSNMSEVVEDVTIETKQTDGISSQDETYYTNQNWSKQLGIYKTIPEFKIALDMRSIWTVGDEIKCNAPTKVILDHITGWGKDTFRSILKNMITVRRLGEDAYAEIIRDDEGTIVNLKVLDTGSIRQVYDKKGNLKRYEQISKLPDGKKGKIEFKPRDIFHLTNKRIADEIHGTADSDALQSILNANNESFNDMRQIMHRFVKPMFKFMLDTDNEAEIEAFIAKCDAAVNKGENIYLPKDTVTQELIAVPANATLNPLPWREHLRNYFYQVVGIPQIVMGSASDITESAAKIAYLSFENSVKDEQTDLIEQIWDQLNLHVKLNFPNSLKNELLSDENKDASANGMPQGLDMQPGDTMAGVAR